jgi:hypothetical protein
MTFTQIIEFRATPEQIDDLLRIEDEWMTATIGRRKALAEQLYVDRDDPTRWVSLNTFPSYEEAMANSNLPETGSQFEQASAIFGHVAFSNLDLAHDLRAEENRRLAEAFAEMMATGKVQDGLFADDAFLDVHVPYWRFQSEGVDAIREAVAGSIDPGHVERWDTTMTTDGFVVQVTVRDGQGRRSHQLVQARAQGGLVREATVFCTGDWSAETERQHSEQVVLARP